MLISHILAVTVYFSMDIMKSTIILVTLLALTFIISGCSTIKKETKEELASPVNCATAREDIKILEEAKTSTGKQILSGVRSILPIAAVAGILSGDYKNRVQVATGKHNDDLANKIEEIKTTCNIK